RSVLKFTAKLLNLRNLLSSSNRHVPTLSKDLMERRASSPVRRKLSLSRNLNRSRIQRDPRSHARTQVAGLDVLTLGHRRLSLDHARNQRRCIVDQLVGREG